MKNNNKVSGIKVEHEEVSKNNCHLTEQTAIAEGLITPFQKSEYAKSFFNTAAIGLIFGLAASLVFSRFAVPPWPTPLFAIALSLLSGFLSGLAGLAGTYLDARLLHWGLKNAPLRAAISFMVVALVTFSIIYTGITVFGIIPPDPGLQRFTLWGMLAGLAFGAIFALFSYRSEMICQKVNLLELENRHLAELASREELLREAARNLAVAEERNRMARELHDSISQGMHGIVYALRTLRPVLKDHEQGLEILGHLEETAAGTLKELRRLVVEFSPSPLEEHDLVEALRLHCDLFARRQKMDLQVTLDYSGGLLPDQEAAVYRIVQEALANIQQHAAAGRVEVTVMT
ncbi:MAG TPA: histidine kinase [Bacillota bacterium]|nr:histidine kinase [Bacillota bacterium]